MCHLVMDSGPCSQEEEQLITKGASSDVLPAIVNSAPSDSDQSVASDADDSERLLETVDSDFDETKGGERKIQLPRWCVLCVVIFVILYLALVVIIELKDDLQPPLKMFRGSAFVIALYMLLPVDICAWEKAGLGSSFRKMFFNNPTGKSLPRSEMLRSASFFALIWSLGLGLCLITSNFDRVFFLVWSVSVWSCLIVYGFFVCKCFKLTLPHRSSRLWFVRVVGRVLTAPFWDVEFADFWLADQLCSLTQTMVDFEFTVCYLLVDYHHPGLEICHCPKPLPECIRPMTASNYIRPIVACLPSYWRFAQCMRIAVTKRNLAQLINAGKYMSQFPVVIFSSLAGLAHIKGHNENYRIYISLWIALSLFHSLYVFVWDVVQDWGLCSSMEYGNLILSRQLYYRGTWKYYCAIIIDFFLRFSWSAKLSIQFGVLQSDSNDMIVAILAMLEVLRRFIWNFFRIENEHAKNYANTVLVSPIN
ncbi:solute carrier family 53 member 1-like [Corticium candelabrum]|uniref:solute carrier family 53 member 1-like n=1 Tax=Corticium candelabrum TaxID=121492 RepID=UPI002E25D1AE|nr:solute carrier family 53 member 1-like [Corticium candelabrum]